MSALNNNSVLVEHSMEQTKKASNKHHKTTVIPTQKAYYPKKPYKNRIKPFWCPTTKTIAVYVCWVPTFLIWSNYEQCKSSETKKRSYLKKFIIKKRPKQRLDKVYTTIKLEKIKNLITSKLQKVYKFILEMVNSMFFRTFEPKKFPALKIKIVFNFFRNKKRPILFV